jgi:hypothetical protein
MVCAAALCLAFAAQATHQLPDPEPAMPPDVLVARIAAWVAGEMGIDAVPAPPRLVLVPAARMRMARLRGVSDAGVPHEAMGHDVLAIYDAARGAIHLPAGWTGATPAEQSMLVHEMVHHLQAMAGQRFACPAEREKAAYAAQERWLARSGQTLEGAFRIDRMFLLVATTCTH